MIYQEIVDKTLCHITFNHTGTIIKKNSIFTDLIGSLPFLICDEKLIKQISLLKEDNFLIEFNMPVVIDGEKSIIDGCYFFKEGVYYHLFFSTEQIREFIKKTQGSDQGFNESSVTVSQNSDGQENDGLFVSDTNRNHMKILIVEDESLIATRTRALLKQEGYSNTHICKSGEDAIIHSTISPPDIILMDFQLNGEINGLEAANIIRDKINVPIVFISAFSERLESDRSSQSDNEYYIDKPLKLEDLRSILNELKWKNQTQVI
ncbi:MAG: response regulator [Cyclobacteriaceae bacterium]|nr:response regulator [Cyclobacteriaceae bacterium]MCH8515548.1 response regulator [Cyclobacteriaceae bacterium]